MKARRILGRDSRICVRPALADDDMHFPADARVAEQFLDVSSRQLPCR